MLHHLHCPEIVAERGARDIMDPLDEIPYDIFVFCRQQGRIVLLGQVQGNGATISNWLLQDIAGQGRNLAFRVHVEKVVLLQILVVAVVDEAQSDAPRRPCIRRQTAELDGVAGHHGVEGEGGGVKGILRIAQIGHVVGVCGCGVQKRSKDG